VICRILIFLSFGAFLLQGQALCQNIPKELYLVEGIPQGGVPTQSPSQAPTVPSVKGPQNSRTKDFILASVGPSAFLGAAFSAGIDQGQNRPREWKQGAEGYGRRFGNSFGQNAIFQTTTYGFDMAFGLDSRYRKSQKTGLWGRMGDVVVQSFTTRTKSGRRIPGFPVFAGSFASGMIPVATWYPDRHGPKDGARIGLGALVGNFGSNLFREFVLRR
jgi:hypothetical protein